MEKSFHNSSPIADELSVRIRAHTAKVGVIGLGYVGLPVVLACADVGFSVLGFDVDVRKIDLLNSGDSYIRHISRENIASLRKNGRFTATHDFSRLSDTDVILLCVPTPLTPQREPDLSHILCTTESIAMHLRRGQLIILESTTYPGTTREIMRPILEKSSLQSGTDFFLAYSPEREDPGNPNFAMRDIPKVVGGDGSTALQLANAFYSEIVSRTVVASSLEVAEAVKLTENIFRAVNVALVNELKIVFEAMGIDVWEVIEAAKTKPFGYMPFYPGPGLGGHCIPIDPFYLTWIARQFNILARFVELAGDVNTSMPQRIVDRAIEILNSRVGRAPKGAHILIIGVAYKKNIDDTRGSPSFKIMEMLEGCGAQVSFYDPFVTQISSIRDHPEFSGRRSVAWERSVIASFDLGIICTDHDCVDYKTLLDFCPLVIDTRNICGRRGLAAGHLFKA
jgi:UDP-N-acetyl-D-glucosamine dehydrogenase